MKLRRWFIRIITILLVLVAVVFIGNAWFLSSQFLYQDVSHECDQAKDIFVFCGDPMEQGIPFENVEFQTSDGLTIRGWYMPAGQSTKAIVFAHGSGANRRFSMRYASLLHEAGYAMLVFDFRNCGESDKSLTSYGYFEKRDIIAALDFLEKNKRILSIGLMGESKGATTGILAMADDKRIRAGIFDSAFADPADSPNEWIATTYGFHVRPLISLAFWFYGVRGGFDTNDEKAENQIGLIAPRPVYIIHGDNDNAIPYYNGERLFTAAREPKQMWTVKGGRHCNSWNIDRRRAENSVKEFFEKYL